CPLEDDRGRIGAPGDGTVVRFAVTQVPGLSIAQGPSEKGLQVLDVLAGARVNRRLDNRIHSPLLLARHDTAEFGEPVALIDEVGFHQPPLAGAGDEADSVRGGDVPGPLREADYQI